MILIIRQPATSEQIAQMSEAFSESFIKLAVIETIVRRLLEIQK